MRRLYRWEIKVRNSPSAVIVVLASVVISMLMLGCSDNPQQQATNSVLDAVADAQHRYEQAIGLMANPIFKIDGEYGPSLAPLGPGDANRLEVLPSDALHPKALTVLQQAQQELAAVLDANKDASKQAQAVGRELLGRIQAQKALYHQQQAQAHRTDALASLDASQTVAGGIGVQSRAIAFFQALAAQTSEQVQAAQATAQQQASEAQTTITSGKGQIEQMITRRADLLRQRNQLNEQAREISRQANQAGGERSLELVDQAQAKAAQAGEAENEIARLDVQIDKARIDLAVAQLELTAAQQRAKSAGDILEMRKRSQADISLQLQGLSKPLDQMKADLVKHLQAATLELAEASKNETEALNSFGPAVGQIKQAQSLYSSMQKQDKATFAASQQAQMLMSQADLRGQMLQAAVKVDQVASQVAQVFEQLKAPAPEQLQSLRQYVDAAKVREQATEDLTEAKTLLLTASQRVRGPQRWLYLGQLGAAHLKLFMINGDQAELAQARTVLAEATADREASPYVANVAEMLRQAQAQQ